MALFNEDSISIPVNDLVRALICPKCKINTKHDCYTQKVENFRIEKGDHDAFVRMDYRCQVSLRDDKEVVN